MDKIYPRSLSRTTNHTQYISYPLALTQQHNTITCWVVVTKPAHLPTHFLGVLGHLTSDSSGFLAFGRKNDLKKTESLVKGADLPHILPF